MHNSDNFQDQEDFDGDQPKSKTQLKNEMLELQELGKQLTELNASKLAEVPMDSELEDAIATFHRIKSREARRRQMQFIGKLMRDADVDAIKAVLDSHKEKDLQRLRFDRLAEEWRDRLLEQGNEALKEFFNEYPGVDLQQVRNLLRESGKEKANNKPPTNQRKLFRYLRDYFVREE
ncbi:ribosome biogenesis factor YjgA [Microbulbifer pacificus]|uniref:ribosome biogenesis factor YjgA n=1 Tax=Microbulbifer pacificus TaxID=407164 RepID=UPI000CF44300|nr:ribosome biogenesis factor YjgA [Microbulbifer pacificus]